MMQESGPQGQESACLLFELAGAPYAVPVGGVFEILWLPELTPLAQAPFDVPGIFNLRGRIVTVIDLNLRLGYRAQPYQTNNRVIVLAEGDRLTGIIVDAVREVRRIESDQISQPPEYGLAAGERASLYISRVARLGDELITILDEEQLLNYSQGLHERILEINESLKESGELDSVPAREIPVFCPEATPGEREIFQKRARALLQSAADQDASDSGVLQIAILELGREYFAIELELVVEFTDVKSLTPIPCSPEHIVGCMNLRGEILTIIDVRGVLNLGMSARNRGSKLAIVRVADMILGVVVEDVLDVLTVSADRLQEIPSGASAAGRRFLRGAVPYGDRFAPLMELGDVILEGGILAANHAESQGQGAGANL